MLSQVQSSKDGLSGAEAEKRLAANGKNKLAEAKKDSLLKRFLKQLADPMILILLAAAFISGILAVVENESFADVIIILGCCAGKRRSRRLPGKQGGESY